MSKRENIERRVRDVVTDLLGVRDNEVTHAAAFIGDLGADSLDQVELVMAVEEEFEMEISYDDAEKIVTFGDAVDYLMKAPIP